MLTRRLALGLALVATVCRADLSAAPVPRAPTSLPDPLGAPVLGAETETLCDVGGAGPVPIGQSVQSVRVGGPAHLADIRPGDTIVRVGLTEIRRSADLALALRQLRPGAAVNVTVTRGGEDVVRRPYVLRVRLVDVIPPAPAAPWVEVSP
jgi:membrane-associated protease RseP (regulator of RpoE activity)